MDEWTLEDVVEAAIDRWQRMRQEAARPKADREFRVFLFEALPEQAAGMGAFDSRDHAAVVYEMATALYREGELADSCLLLRWYCIHYAGHPDGGLAVQVIDVVTDLCAYTGRVDPAGNAAAAGVLRDVVDACSGQVDIEVERALCRALACCAHLRGDLHAAGDLASKRAAAGALWAEIFRRYRDSPDAGLRGRAAQGLFNTALVALQTGDEKAAREKFGELVKAFGPDRGSDAEMDDWLLRAEHGGTVLDLFVVGEPELNLDYLRKQRQWDRKRRRKGFGLHWLLAGAPRNQMTELVRAARTKHEASVNQLRSWLCCAEPFVLLLRNFDLAEQSATSSPLAPVFDDPGDPQGDYVQVISHRDGETALTEFDRAVPMVTVASTKAAELELSSTFGQFVPGTALYLPDATWFGTVSTLVPLAARIIVWAGELTPALEQELSCLREHGRTADTTIIVEKPPSPFTQMYLPPRREHDGLTADHPALAGFPNTVDARGLKGRGIAESPPLLDVIEALEVAGAIPVELRLEKIRAHLSAVR